MAGYRTFCNKCNAEVGFGKHATWCSKGFDSRESWEDHELNTWFSYVMTATFMIYECRRCAALVRNRVKHYNHHANQHQRDTLTIRTH